MNNFAVKSTKRGKNLWSVYGEKAITQIKDRRYAEYLKNEGRADILLYGRISALPSFFRYSAYLKNEGRADILLYGISFCKKRCKAVVEELK